METGPKLKQTHKLPGVRPKLQIRMARFFQNCVMLFKMAARFPNIWALGDILVPVSWQTKSKKTPFLARSETISNTVYNTLE